MILISSLQNPLIKDIQKMDKNRERKKRNLFLAEGLRECRLAIEGGFTIEKLLFCQSYITKEELIKETGIIESTELIELTPQVFDSLVYRKGIPNCLALVQNKIYHLEDIPTKKDPFILIIDSVEKPGNLGAMLRTCDAAGIDAVIVCDPQTDIYNPNCIRSSLGAVFTQKVIVIEAETCINWLKKKQINTYVTYLEAADIYTKEDFTKSTAIVMGSEAFGINKKWLEHGFKHIIIPQFGKVDSMNVANSAAIVIYEGLRQRGFK
jgi:RNA methyltransferase, TrmH family